MRPGSSRRIVSVALSLALVWFVATPMYADGSLASFRGRVFQPDRATPRAGVIVRLVDGAGEVGIESAPTRKDGGFTIERAPAGSYSLEVTTPEGVFVLPQTLELAPGANAPVALQLRSQPMNAKQEHGIGDGNMSRRTGYIIAGVIAVAALLVFLQITEDTSEKPASID